MEKIRTILQKPIFHQFTTIAVVWMALALIAGILKYPNNNFQIFRGVFWHVLNQLPLYVEYPFEYNDVNLYGPAFSFFIAPFSIMPQRVGFFFWLLALSGFLFVSIRMLPFERGKIIFIGWFCANELLTALFLAQFNIAIAAILLLSFAFIEKEDDIWAALLIAIGTFVKIYGLAGLAFFFFSRHKWKFVLSFIGWSILLFVIPMLFSSPEYIVNQYGEWFSSLASKSDKNLFSIYQNISLLGIVRKISGNPYYSDLWLLIGGLILFVAPYFRFRQYRFQAFRQMFLASTMLFVVLFSTGSESSGYIIALIGVCVWYVSAPWKRSKADLFLMIFAFILTSLSPTDIFPRAVKEMWIKPYALKALPCVLIWFKLIYEMMVKNYATVELATHKK